VEEGVGRRKERKRRSEQKKIEKEVVEGKEDGGKKEERKRTKERRGMKGKEKEEKEGGKENLAETHFVGEDAVDTVIIEANHPIQTIDLIIAHLA